MRPLKEIEKFVKMQNKMTKINVAAHAKRYVDVDTADKLALIEELKALVENDRVNKIKETEEYLQRLKNGEFPMPAASAKKQVAPETESTVMEAEFEPEATPVPAITAEEDFSNL